VGSGLFDFGDIDGDCEAARFQHPLGVDVEAGVVYVADTYNNKIKRITIDSGEVSSIAGSGDAGRKDGPVQQASFYEPGGLSVGNGLIYVADTNNNAVRSIDPAAGMVATLVVDF
jgi:hypothetical protein